MPEDRSLAALLRDVRDAWRILALSVVACGLAAVLATVGQADRYQADGSVVVSPARFLDPSGTDALPALTDTVVELSSRDAVLDPVRTAYVNSAPDAATRARRSREATLDWLRLNTEARRVATSSVIEMSATGSTARDARDLARAFVSSLTTFVREARTGDAPSGNGPVGVGLVILASGGPASKISPTPLRNLFIGVNAGIVVGIVLALAVGARRRRRSAARAAAELGVPSLGDVRPGTPESGGGLFATHNLLRALSASSGTLAVVLTGTTAGDRVAEVAESLVRSLDRSGNRALLVDGDGERRELSRSLGAAERPGLLDAAADGADASRLIFTAHPDNGTGKAAVHLLPAGATSPSNVVLVAACLQPILESLRPRFNVLVICGPTLGNGAVLPALVSVADCWLLVADADVTARRLADVRALIELSGTPMMGTLGIDGAGRRPRQPASA